MSLLPCRATPDAAYVLKKVKTCSRWFHSQIIAVPELTPPPPPNPARYFVH